MARIKTDSTELVTDKSLQQIANGIREACLLYTSLWPVLKVTEYF